MARAEDQALLDEAVELTRALWRAYLIDRSEEGDATIGDVIDQTDFSLIGTGRHEFYTAMDQFLESYASDRLEAEDVEFDILDEYYEGRTVSPDVILVFGTLWVRERPSEPKPLLVEMDTRFSVVYHLVDGKLKVVHLHHSMPNIDQRKDEFYPKTVTERANAALEYTKILERRADLDSMTNLYNRMAFERMVDGAIARGETEAVLLMIDLDNFKSINDTLGHLEGDRAIIEFAEVLRDVFPGDSIVGRLGGDEFAALCQDETSVAGAESAAENIIERWAARGEGRTVPFGCSVGMARVGSMSDFRELYCAADTALYKSKRNGKGRFAWFA